MIGLDGKSSKTSLELACSCMISELLEAGYPSTLINDIVLAFFEGARSAYIVGIDLGVDKEILEKLLSDIANMSFFHNLSRSRVALFYEKRENMGDDNE